MILELNEWSYCIGKYLNDFQFKKVSLTEEETKLVLKEKNLMAKISGNMCEILLDFTAGSELDFNDECKTYFSTKTLETTRDLENESKSFSFQ